MIGLIHKDQLAAMWGYSDANNAFRDFCLRMRITPVPGRNGWYDPRLIRRRLDEAQGLVGPAMTPDTPAPTMGLVAQRRARNGTTA